MKKFFSLIALAGVLAACTPEQIQTAFKLDGAKGVIAVEVVKLDGAPISGQFQIAGYQSLPNSSITYEGNKALIAFYAAESTAISEQVLTLTATGDQIITPVSTTVTVPDLIAGQVVALSGRIRVGESVDGWYFMYDEEAGMKSEKVGFLANPHYATYAYTHGDVDSWYVNNSENMLMGTVPITYKEGYSAGRDVVFPDYSGFETVYPGGTETVVVKDWVENAKAGNLQEITVNYEFMVSAWAMWNVVVRQIVTPVVQSILAVKLNEDGTAPVADGKPLASATVYTVASVTADKYECSFGAEELPYPDAAGHYVPGNGAAHGGENAGGGISFNE